MLLVFEPMAASALTFQRADDSLQHSILVGVVLSYGDLIKGGPLCSAANIDSVSRDTSLSRSVGLPWWLRARLRCLAAPGAPGGRSGGGR